MTSRFRAAARLSPLLLALVIAACATKGVRETAPAAGATASPDAARTEPIAAPDPAAVEERRSTPAPDVAARVEATPTSTPAAPAIAEAAKPSPAPVAAKPNPKKSPPSTPTPAPGKTSKPAKPPKPRVAATSKPPATSAIAKPAPARTAPAKTAPEAAAEAKNATAIAGRLELVAGNRQKVSPGEIAEGLVYFLPKAGSPRPKPGRYSIDTHSKGFTPTLLVVPVGSTVSFPNSDDILHNVFSRTPGTTFDLGFYGPGETRRHVFAKPGLVIVNCNVHHTMRANVLVLETPYYTRPDKAGNYRLDGLPPGPGTLVLWHPRSKAQTVAIAGETGAVVRRLTADKPRLDVHATTAR